MTTATSPALPPRRADYVHFLRIQTRWMDNDVYGHVNNVVYYSYFDTVINRYLAAEGGLDIARGAVIGLCVESQCRYLAPAAFPDDLDAGLRVTKVGRSSVRYEVGLFGVSSTSPGAPDHATPSAFGHFVHVFVDRATRRAVPLPDPLRRAVERLAPPASP
jgi:acyl-CoA thioester hydrolase